MLAGPPVRVKVVPLITGELLDAVAAGFGFTVMVAVADAVHELAEPVIVYVAVAEVVLLLLDNVWAIEVPQEVEQAVPPLIPVPCVTLQV